MSVLASTYPISKPGSHCAATHRALAVGDRYVAALVERPGQPALERLDFSFDAWQAGARPERPLRLFGFWRAVFAAPDEKKHALLGDAELLDLFEEMDGTAIAGDGTDANQPRQLAFRYLLALLLVRRRVLRLIASKPGSIVVRPKPAAPNLPEPPDITVPDPGMDDANIKNAIDQLGRIVAPEAAKAARP